MIDFPAPPKKRTSGEGIEGLRVVKTHLASNTFNPLPSPRHKENKQYGGRGL